MSARSLLVKRLPCLACEWEGFSQPLPTESHHLNTGGLAGQKRRGDEYQIPLCSWHHRGEILDGTRAKDMTMMYGPSLARQSKMFRLRYGTDQELLAKTNAKLEVA